MRFRPILPVVLLVASARPTLAADPGSYSGTKGSASPFAMSWASTTGVVFTTTPSGATGGTGAGGSDPVGIPGVGGTGDTTSVPGSGSGGGR